MARSLLLRFGMVWLPISEESRRLSCCLRAVLFLHQGGETIDLIVSDVRMPGASGQEILEQFHHCPGFPPMILITAFGDEQAHVKAEWFGAAAMFDKPFDVDMLIEKVGELLAREGNAEDGRSGVRSKE